MYPQAAKFRFMYWSAIKRIPSACQAYDLIIKFAGFSQCSRVQVSIRKIKNPQTNNYCYQTVVLITPKFSTIVVEAFAPSFQEFMISEIR